MNVAEEIYIYGILLGPVHIAVGALLAIFLTPLLRRSRQAYGRAVGRALLFNGCLLVSGMMFHTLWSEIVFTKLYCNWDYVIDFTPFWPPLREAVTIACTSPSHGTRLPVPYSATFAAWVVFAVASWLAAIALYLVIVRMLERKSQSTHCNDRTCPGDGASSDRVPPLHPRGSATREEIRHAN